jgi:hypothetical protein
MSLCRVGGGRVLQVFRGRSARTTASTLWRGLVGVVCQSPHRLELCVARHIGAGSVGRRPRFPPPSLHPTLGRARWASAPPSAWRSCAAMMLAGSFSAAIAEASAWRSRCGWAASPTPAASRAKARLAWLGLTGVPRSVRNTRSSGIVPRRPRNRRRRSAMWSGWRAGYQVGPASSCVCCTAAGGRARRAAAGLRLPAGRGRGVGSARHCLRPLTCSGRPAGDGRLPPVPGPFEGGVP